MEFLMGFMIFAFVLAAFLPYTELTKKNNLKNLRKHISDGEGSAIPISAMTNMMEKVFKYSEKFYPYIKEKIKLDVHKKYSQNIIVALSNQLAIGSRRWPPAPLRITSRRSSCARKGQTTLCQWGCWRRRWMWCRGR